MLNDVSFTIPAGEIVGLAGLVGSGRTELARAVSGADPVDTGTIRVDGTDAASARRPTRSGPGSRSCRKAGRKKGSSWTLTLAANTTSVDMRSVSAKGFLRPVARAHEGPEPCTLSLLPSRRPSARVANLSGGNQQKVLFARWLFKQPRVLILDEPTRGVDVGARAAIHRLIHDLAEQGAAILMISSELEEVLGLAHRVLVIRRGTITHEFAADPPLGNVMEAAFGSDGEHHMTAEPPQAAAASDNVPEASIAPPAPGHSHRVRAEHIRDYGIILVFIAMFLFLTFKSDVFLTKDNLLNLVYSNSAVGIAACAVTLVVIGGNFDLSLGGIYILSGLLAAWAAVHWNIWLGFPSGSRPASRWG